MRICCAAVLLAAFSCEVYAQDTQLSYVYGYFPDLSTGMVISLGVSSGCGGHVTAQGIAGAGFAFGGLYIPPQNLGSAGLYPYASVFVTLACAGGTQIFKLVVRFYHPAYNPYGDLRKKVETPASRRLRIYGCWIDGVRHTCPSNGIRG